jgi:hypothetical protein
MLDLEGVGMHRESASEGKSMRQAISLLTLLVLAACQQQLSPTEKAAKDRSECQALATQQSGFDPLTAEEPQRSISTTRRRGGEVVGSGAVVRGAAGGAALGAVGGAIAGNAGPGAAAGAAVGGLLGGVRRHRETNEMVTTTHTNPEYVKYTEAKDAFRAAFDQCLAGRAGADQ